MIARTIKLAVLSAATGLVSGCFVLHPPCVEPDDLDFYRTVAVTNQPIENAPPPGAAPLSTELPLVVDPASLPPPWDLKLQETIQLGLENSKVLRDLGGSVLRRPDLAQTIHDPAIQATDPRFGMEGALAAFDAQVATRLFSYKNDRAFNNLFAGGGTFLFRQDLNNFENELTKQTATGAAFAVRQHIDYDANNAPANLFHSYYNVNIETEFRQPLLQRAGVDFNRIAGPNAMPGVINGVVIARINNDVSTAEFEIGLRDLISNLENGYWDLYYAYRDLDAKVAARDTSLKIWRMIDADVKAGRKDALQEVQAREQYYRFQEEVLDALGGRPIDRTRTFNGSSGGTFRGVGGLQMAERRLRLWMGVTINDGKLIRPTDVPPQAKVSFDWCQLMDEALARRPDLRRQQSKVQRYHMELIANRNFLLPQLDIIGLYRWRGFGHDLLGPRNAAEPFNNAFANLTSGEFQEWELGFEYTMPLGFRRAHAAVRNSQLLIARERAILEEQERQAIHDLSAAYADADRAHAVTQVAYNRLAAAEQQFKLANNAYFNLGGKVSLELVLDSRIRLAEAETAYHRSRIEYAVALKNVHFEKGSLLDYSGTMLASGASCEGVPAVIAHKGLRHAAEDQINYSLARPIGAREATAGPAPPVNEAKQPRVAQASYDFPVATVVGKAEEPAQPQAPVAPGESAPAQPVRTNEEEPAASIKELPVWIGPQDAASPASQRLPNVGAPTSAN